MKSKLPLVLLAEDEPAIADIIEISLEEAGFAVLRTSSGVDAIKGLEARPKRFCAVVTDIKMPGASDGWDVGRRARELISGVPVVYMSGDSTAEWTSQGVPGSVMIAKPFAPVQVVTAISSLMNQTDT